MIENYGQINDRAPHLIADLCEIISYFEGREVSRGDIEGFLFEKGGAGLLADLDLEGLDSAAANERYQALTEDVFSHLTYRKQAFGKWYPFNIEGDLLVPCEEIDDFNKVYVSLLAYSRLKMFSRPQRSQYAAEFEVLCKEAAKGFSDGWEVIHFGAGGADREDFGTKLKDALHKLSEKLREIAIVQEIDALSEHDSGDAGIDLILMRQWSDPARGLPVYFAQCAARQEGWPSKRFEAHAINLRKYFAFFHPPGTLLFIPVCYRNVDGRWIDTEGSETVLMDRLRLIELLEIRMEKATPEEVLGSISKPFELGCAAAA